MNFVAHVHIALCLAGEEGDGDELAFGAALPDLSSMVGVRFDRDRLPEAVRDGVVLHHRTDAVFHAHRQFAAGVAALRSRLQAGGLPPGPSRAIGHAGWELLLDGYLLDGAEMETAFSRVLARAPDVAGALQRGEGERWRRLLESTRADRWWLGYRETAVIALRLERRLRARTRLAFEAADVPVVAAALARSRTEVARVAEPLLGDVLDQLSPLRRTPPRPLCDDAAEQNPAATPTTQPVPVTQPEPAT